MKAMNPSVSKRYASATQMLEDLEHFKNDPDFKMVIPASEPAVIHETTPADATIKLKNTGEVNSGEASPRPSRQKQVAVKETPQAKKMFPASLVFSICAVVVFFIGAIYFIVAVVNPFGGDSNVEKIKVPQLVGKTLSEVQGDEAYSQFEIVEGEKIYDDEIAAGVIISQDPEDGKMAASGSKITVTISRGPKSVILEDYTDMEYRQAEIALDRLGITYIEQRENSETVEKDHIIRTEPGNGTELSSGDSVVLIISDGKATIPVNVPDLYGMTEEQARDALTKAGLVCGNASPVESEEPNGTVVFQTVPAKSTVDSGTIVDIHISKNENETSPSNPDETTTDSGTLYDPYPDSEDKRTYNFTVNFIEAEGPISVRVDVNGNKEYEGTHYTSEGSVTLPLTAYSGYNTIKVYQNDTLTQTIDVEF